MVNPSWYDSTDNPSSQTTKSTLQHSIGIGTAFRDWIPASVIETNRCIHSCQNKRIRSADQVTSTAVLASDSQLSLCPKVVQRLLSTPCKASILFPEMPTSRTPPAHNPQLLYAQESLPSSSRKPNAQGLPPSNTSCLPRSQNGSQSRV